jgi:hypothetical protein
VSSQDLQQGADVLLQLLREHWQQHDQGKILHSKLRKTIKVRFQRLETLGCHRIELQKTSSLQAKKGKL